MEDVRTDLRPGHRLLNGAKILAIRGEYVLAFLEFNDLSPYVTWSINAEGHTFGGHYFEDIEVAVKDLVARFNRR